MFSASDDNMCKKYEPKLTNRALVKPVILLLAQFHNHRKPNAFPRNQTHTIIHKAKLADIYSFFLEYKIFER